MDDALPAPATATPVASPANDADLQQTPGHAEITHATEIVMAAGEEKSSNVDNGVVDADSNDNSDDKDDDDVLPDSKVDSRFIQHLLCFGGTIQPRLRDGFLSMVVMSCGEQVHREQIICGILAEKPHWIDMQFVVRVISDRQCFMRCLHHWMQTARGDEVLRNEVLTILGSIPTAWRYSATMRLLRMMRADGDMGSPSLTHAFVDWPCDRDVAFLIELIDLLAHSPASVIELITHIFCVLIPSPPTDGVALTHSVFVRLHARLILRMNAAEDRANMARVVLDSLQVHVDEAVKQEFQALVRTGDARGVKQDYVGRMGDDIVRHNRNIASIPFRTNVARKRAAVANVAATHVAAQNGVVEK